MNETPAMPSSVPPSLPARDRRTRIPATDMVDVIQSVRDAIRVAVSAFEAAGLSYGQGTANSYDDAIALVYWTLHLPPDAPDTLLDARISADEVRACAASIQERVDSRLPVAYITGEAWLRGLRFKADARALVPRSLLVEAMQETLIDWRLDAQPEMAGANPNWPIHVLDLCTGGGSIAIHAAGFFPDADVIAMDIDPDALALCAENVALHGLTDRITVRQSDLLNDAGNEVFDLILCNPPYVPATSMRSLPPEFRQEPEHALAGGQDGMTLIRRLLDGAAHHLADDGLLLVEIGHEWAAFEAAFPALSFTYLPVTAGDRMIVAIARTDLMMPQPALVQ